MCRNAADRSQVDNTLLHFNTLLQSVLIDNFLQPLPALIAKIRQRTEPTDNAESSGGKKRKKRETCLVKNTQMDPDWKLRPGKKWGKVFARRYLKCQLDYNRQKVCHRWQIQGNCYADCRNTATYVAKDKFSADICSAFDA